MSTLLPLGSVPDYDKARYPIKATTISERSTRNAKRQFRRLYGRFVADECGVRYVPDIEQYDPKSAEKIVEKREPITADSIARVKSDLASDPEKRAEALTGMMAWLGEYMVRGDRKN